MLKIRSKLTIPFLKKFQKSKNINLKQEKIYFELGSYWATGSGPALKKYCCTTQSKNAERFIGSTSSGPTQK